MGSRTFFTCVIRFLRSILAAFVSLATFSLSTDDIESGLSGSSDVAEGLNAFLSPVSFFLM